MLAVSGTRRACGPAACSAPRQRPLCTTSRPQHPAHPPCQHARQQQQQQQQQQWLAGGARPAAAAAAAASGGQAGSGRRWLAAPPRATAGGGSADGDDGGDDDAGTPAKPDIDALAAFLTQQAAAMRASLDEADLADLPAAGDSSGASAPPASASASASAAGPGSGSEDVGAGGADDEEGGGGDDAAAASGQARADDDGTALSGADAARASADEAVAAGAAMPGSGAPLLNTLDFLDEFEEEGGFISQDFAIVKLLGKLGVQDVAAAASRGGSRGVSPTASLDGGGGSDAAAAGPPLSSSDGGDGGVTPNILVYAARYNSGLPYEGPITVQLREYLPGSRRVAINELLLQQRLCGRLPTRKWEAAAADPTRVTPVVQLLGYLRAPPSDEAYELTADPADTIWMVYKFEALRPLSLMLQQMDLPEEPTGLQNLFLKKEAAVAAALAARRRLLVAVAEGLLSAISFCHQRGVAHCGIGAGCVMVNTCRDKEVDRLLVKLDNFGLARMYAQPLEVAPGEQGLQQLATFAANSSLSGTSSGGGTGLLGLEDTDAALQRQEDLQAAALLLTELFLVGSASAGSEVMDAAVLKRLLFEVFHEDVALFKEYCLQDEENCAGFVEFMDEDGGAGWALLEALMAGTTSAGELLRTSRLLAGAASQK